MQRTFFSLFTAVALVSGAAAQTQNGTAPSESRDVPRPSTPAPVVQVAPAPSAATQSAPSAAPAANASNGVTQIVYTPKLPTAEDLKTAAAAQGMQVERIVQTSIQVIAFYRDARGQEMTVAYQTVPPTATAAPAAPMVATPAPTVVYRTAPRVIYYDDYPYNDYPYYGYSYPGVWYPPVSLSFGFGFGHGGYYRGGFRHWR